MKKQSKNGREEYPIYIFFVIFFILFYMFYSASVHEWYQFRLYALPDTEIITNKMQITIHNIKGMCATAQNTLPQAGSECSGRAKKKEKRKIDTYKLLLKL